MTAADASDARVRPEPQLRVAAWPAGHEGLANPYTRLFSAALAAHGCRVDDLEWKRLFVDRYDIVHVHWPEWVLDSGSALRIAVASSALRAARLRGARLFWTVHNLENHERPRSRLGSLAARDFTSQVDAVVSLTPGGVSVIRAQFPRLRTVPAFVVPHGHYRGVYPDEVSREEARATLGVGADSRVIASVGLLRPYKGIEALIRTFRDLDDPDAVLLVAGRPVSEDYGRSLLAAARADPRVRVELGLVPVDEMQRWMRAADLVALPYTASFNSGAAFLALSFDRPVLAPRLGSFCELRDHVGAQWIHVYDEPLDVATLDRALTEAAGLGAMRVDLSDFDWDTIGAEMVRAYRAVRASSARNGQPS